MDFSYEFLTFQCGNHDTKEKLEFYHNLIMRLLGEVKTLRETMCAPCQHKCVATRFGNQLLAAPNDSMRPLKEPHVEDALPLMPEADIFYTPAASPGSSSPLINERKVSDSSSLVEISTERNKLSNESNDRRFYAERDALADATFGVTFVGSFRHENHVRCVSFSPDGRYLAVGTGDDDKNGSIVIYEVESCQKYCELREYATQYGSYTRHLPWTLCFSSDGRYIAVGDEAVIIWDVPKKRIRSIFHWRYETDEVRFSPDGRLVAFWTDGGVFVLNMRDNSTRRMASEGICFNFNPDGRLIATGKDDVVGISDVRTGKVVKRWNGHGECLRCVKFTSDGRGLLCVYDDMIEQWDMSDAEPFLIRKFDIQINPSYNRTSVSPDHRLVACSDQLLDIDSGKPQCTLKGHDDVFSVDFSAAGTYLAMGDWEGLVSLWKYARS